MLTKLEIRSFEILDYCFCFLPKLPIHLNLETYQMDFHFSGVSIIKYICNVSLVFAYVLGSIYVLWSKLCEANSLFEYVQASFYALTTAANLVSFVIILGCALNRKVLRVLNWILASFYKANKSNQNDDKYLFSNL